MRILPLDSALFHSQAKCALIPICNAMPSISDSLFIRSEKFYCRVLQMILQYHLKSCQISRNSELEKRKCLFGQPQACGIQPNGIRIKIWHPSAVLDGIFGGIASVNQSYHHPCNWRKKNKIGNNTKTE